MAVDNLNNFTLLTEILFSVIAFAISILSWILIANAGKMKQALTRLEVQIQEAEQKLPELESALKFKQPNLQEILLNPLFLTKLIEVIFLFRGGQLTKLALVKTFFK